MFASDKQSSECDREGRGGGGDKKATATDDKDKNYAKVKCTHIFEIQRAYE